MEETKVLVVEDDKLSATEIEISLNEMGYKISGFAQSSKEVYPLVSKAKPDIILMDIYIEGELDGIEVAQTLEETKIPILFITSSEDQKLYEKARKLSNFAGFIIKPLNTISLQSSIDMAVNSFAGEEPEDMETAVFWNSYSVDSAVLIKQANTFHKIDIVNINYVAATGNYCYIYTNSQKFLVNLPLFKILQILPSRLFIRVHRKYAVQINKIENISTAENTISIGGQTIPISRMYKDRLFNIFKIIV